MGAYYRNVGKSEVSCFRYRLTDAIRYDEVDMKPQRIAESHLRVAFLVLREGIIQLKIVG